MGRATKLERETQLDPDEFREVYLGSVKYVMVGQPIGWLRQQFGIALAGLSEDISPDDIDESLLRSDNFIKMLGERVYRVLYAFVGDDLMPEWQFHGFPTKERWEENDYRREEDIAGVTPTQVKKALLAGAELNEIDLLKHLGKLLGPTLVKGFVTEALVRSIDTVLPTSSSANTPESPSEKSSETTATQSPGTLTAVAGQPPTTSD